MGLPKATRSLDQTWNGADANLEDELLLYDFFRREEDYSNERPLIVCKDGGLLALYQMDGIDPEPLGGDGLAGASAALRRAFDVLNPEALEGDWRRGTWEVQNIFSRREGSAPEIAPPTRRALRGAHFVVGTAVGLRPRPVVQVVTGGRPRAALIDASHLPYLRPQVGVALRLINTRLIRQECF
jgi:hypothetical protein